MTRGPQRISLTVPLPGQKLKSRVAAPPAAPNILDASNVEGGVNRNRAELLGDLAFGVPRAVSRMKQGQYPYAYDDNLGYIPASKDLDTRFIEKTI